MNILSFIKNVKKRIGPLRGSFGIGSHSPEIDQIGFDDVERFKTELGKWELEGDIFDEVEGYLERDYKRFLYTVYLVPNNTGRLLELGACPYFITRLLKEVRNYELFLANYWEGAEEKEQVHRIFYTENHQQEEFRFKIFNSEREEFPYESEYFDVILFCEILEHLTEDPAHTISEINRVLKPNGICVLTTPNVNRFVNIRKLLLGENVYDQYSGHGSYGRHNREYTIDEARHLLTLHGFQIEMSFTADVWPNEPTRSRDMLDVVLKILTHRRKYDLGEYIFIRARKTEKCCQKRSFVFYRSRHDIVQEY
jgi:SAM-dependent methyltransferase